MSQLLSQRTVEEEETEEASTSGSFLLPIFMKEDTLTNYAGVNSDGLYI